MADVVTLPPLDRAGVEDVLRQMGQPLAALGDAARIVERLYWLSEGDPLLVRLYVEALLPWGDDAALMNPADLEGLDPGLGAFFQRPGRHRLIVEARQDYDRHSRGLVVDLDQAAHSRLIRKHQVQENDVEALLGQTLTRLAEPLDMRQFKRWRFHVRQRLADQAGITRVIFHK
jgi:hypothetical protein